MKSLRRVLVFPAWKDNPYLNLLALSARASGYQFLSSTQFHGLLESFDRLEKGDVFHLHWTSPLVQPAPSVADARERLEVLADAISKIKARGVKIVWTIHNRLPHELVYRDEEIELHRLIARAADAVHIMNPATPAAIADICTLDPEKVTVIPHPSYGGVYPAAPERAQARRQFGLEDGDLAVLFLGQIRPYKGVETLVEAVTRLSRDGQRIVLLLAGAVKEFTVDSVRELVPDDVRAVLHLEFVDDADIADWFTAADVAVFPYRAILNSGSLHLAATFGVPAVMPDEPHLRAMLDGEDWVRFFDTDAPVDTLTGILADADSLTALRGGSDGFISNISPWTVSTSYKALLDRLTA